MANVLTWKDIDYNPVDAGQGGLAAATMFNNGMNALSEGITDLQKRRVDAAGIKGFGNAMQYTDIASWNKAAQEGRLQIAPGYEDFFKARAADLLANEKSREEITGVTLDNVNQGIANDQGVFDLYKSKDTYADQEAVRAAQLEAAPLIAEITADGTSNDPVRRARAQAAMQDPTKAALLSKAGYDLQLGVRGLVTDASAERVRDAAQHDEDLSRAKEAAQIQAAPIQAELARLSTLGTPEAADQIAKIYQDNTELFKTAEIDVPAGITGAAAAATAGATAAGDLATAVDATQARADQDAADKRYNEIESSKPFVNHEAAIEAINNMSDLTPEARAKLVERVTKEKATLFPEVDVNEEQRRMEREATASVTSPSTVRPSAPATISDVENQLAEAVRTGQLPPAELNKSLTTVGNELDAQAKELNAKMGIDTAVSGSAPAVLKTMMNPRDIAAGDRITEIKAAYEGLAPSELDADAEETMSDNYAQFEDEVDTIERDYHVAPDVAIELAKAAISQAGWYKPWEGNFEVSQDKVHEYVSSILDPWDPENPNKDRTTKATAILRQQAAKATATENLTNLQTQYREAVTDYYGALKRGNNEVSTDALAIVADLGKRYRAELDRIYRDPKSQAALRSNGR